MNRGELKAVIKDRVFVRSSPDVAIIPRGVYEYKDLPWYCDFRAIAFCADSLEFWADEFWSRFESLYPFQIGGLESSSLPLMTAVIMKGHQRGTPVRGFFMRKSRKRDGLLKMFEGNLSDESVILVDDGINSGQSVHRAILALSQLGKTVTNVFVLLAYRDPAKYRFAQDYGIRISSIFTLDDFDVPLLSHQAPEVPRDSFEVKWHKIIGKGSLNFVLQKSGPMIDNTNVYVGTDNGVFVALDQRNGEVVWQLAIGPHPRGKGIFSSAAIDAKSVYFGGYDGVLYALDLHSGARRWTYMEPDWIGSSPVIAPDLGLLFIGLEFALPRARGGLAAISMRDGRQKWIQRFEGFTHGTPLYIQGQSMVLTGNQDKILRCFDARTGILKWECYVGGDIQGSMAFDAMRKLIVFGSSDGTIQAVHADDGSAAFSFETNAPIFSTPLIIGGCAYVSSLDKLLYAIDLDTGLPRWHFMTRGRIFASPVLADGSIWIGSNDGRLYELDPNSGELRSFFQATERIVNAIAFNERTRRLFVPTVANELYCLERRRS
jgi:outer membrane protein assembly factor BamB